MVADVASASDDQLATSGRDTLTTSGDTPFSAILYVALLALTVQLAVVLAERGRPTPPASRFRLFVSPREAGGAVGIWLLVAVPSVLQSALPDLLLGLRRDPNLILNGGEPWRVVTSLVVQDGGLAGTVFNLVVLAIVAVLAVRVWGTMRSVAILLAGQLLFGTLATFVSTDLGAGNSGATFALAASFAGLALLCRPEPTLLIRSVGVILIALVSIWLGDAHGLAMLGGVGIGAVVGLVAPPVVTAGPSQ